MAKICQMSGCDRPAEPLSLYCYEHLKRKKEENGHHEIDRLELPIRQKAKRSSKIE
jgi:hypothetical protein